MVPNEDWFYPNWIHKDTWTYLDPDNFDMYGNPWWW
jgi:hypothetical protein